MQQKQAQLLELQVELNGAQERSAELQEQLSAEKLVAAELRSELAQTKLELETTLKAQHKHLKELEAFRCAGLPWGGEGGGRPWVGSAVQKGELMRGVRKNCLQEELQERGKTLDVSS